MSEKALALIFINLGGEMLYVLDQRLFAQKINTEKGNKIMSDIVSNMFSERFIEEIFRPQEPCSRKALRTIFERLAHTSIMRLNESSMDKLFDLMTMAVKYQMSLVSSPRELLLVTLNHLDSVLPFVKDNSLCCSLIEKCYSRVLDTFVNMNDYEIQFVRYTILNFFQDLRIKVSVFLKEKLQNWDGSFILYKEGPVSHGAAIPGLITYYENENVLKESTFNPHARYCRAPTQGSYERKGDRILKLGLNVYCSNKPVDTIISTERTGKKNVISSDLESNVPDPKSKAQLDYLCKLIGKTSKVASNDSRNDFKLNLFNNDEEEFIYNTNSYAGAKYEEDNADEGVNYGKFVKIDASKRSRDDRLNKVMSQFDDDRTRSVGGRGGGGGGGGCGDSRKKQLIQDDDDEDDIITMMDKMNR